MLKYLKSIKGALITGLEYIVVGLVAGLVLDVLWQVFSRFLLRNPSSWTDELATLLIIWVALLGGSVAFVRNQHLGVDYFVSKLPARARLLCDIFVQLLVGVFAGVVLTWGGAKLVALTLLTEQVSPALGLKMGHVYLALPISGIIILFVAVEGVLEGIGNLKADGRRVAE